MKNIHNPEGVHASQTSKNKHHRVSIWLLVGLVLVALGQSGHVFWQNKTLLKTVTQTKEKIAVKEKKIKEFTAGEEVDSHLKGVAVLEKVVEERISWSEAQREITRLEKGAQGHTLFLDYSSDSDGNFSLQGVSQSLEGVAQTLGLFQGSLSFADPFVTNISEETNTEVVFSGKRPRKIYRFTLLFDFKNT